MNLKIILFIFSSFVLPANAVENGCLLPTGFSVFNIAANSATLTWDEMQLATSYYWEIGATGFLPGTGTALFTGDSPTSSTDLAGLDSGTYYDAYVKTVCGGLGESEFAGPLNFSTAVSAVEDNRKLVWLDVFPNPAGEKVHLQFLSQGREEAKVVVRNILGQTVKVQRQSLQAGANHMTFELAGLPSGVYLLCLEGKIGNRTLRLVKN